MSKRFDNRRMLYVLVGLVIILSLTILVKIPSEKATLKERLVDLDSARVSKIILTPRISEGPGFEFIKKNGKWMVQQGSIVAVPEQGSVQNILMEVMNLKPKSLEAVDKSKWKEFNLTDSLAIRVLFQDDKSKPLADLMIGRFTYSQSKNPYADPRSGGIQGTSFVRLHNEKKVYAVDGFLSLSFSGKFNDYRDKSFLKLDKANVTKISFRFPSDSSFILQKKDSIWHAGVILADSLATANYLDGLRYINGQDFADNYKPVTNPMYELSVEGNNLLNLSVKCFKGDKDDEFILNSSLSPDVYFNSKKDGIFDKLFKSRSYFTTKNVKKVAK